MKRADVYDIEILSDYFCMVFIPLKENDDRVTLFEISRWKNDWQALYNYVKQNIASLWGFNNFFFDDPLLWWVLNNENPTPQQIYRIAQEIINREKWYPKLPFPTGDIFKCRHYDRFGVS